MIYIKLNKKDQYIFTSERLGFRNWNHMDLEELVELNSDEMVMEHFPKTLTENEVGELIKSLKKLFALNGFTYYATEIKETGTFVGMIGLALQEYKTAYTPAIDIGWRLKRRAWGRGYATEGAKAFPANVNVAAAVGLAGIGADKTELQIWADPKLKRNTHKVEVDSDSAIFEMSIQNVQTPENPGTGKITALSVIACLRGLTSPFKIGT